MVNAIFFVLLFLDSYDCNGSTKSTYDAIDSYRGAVHFPESDESFRCFSGFKIDQICKIYSFVFKEILFRFNVCE